MSSRLSSLLVRDGVIGVKRMEKAFQRQVLFGGELDTILLEMNEVTEQRLVQYLSLAAGLPPATSRELDHIDPNVAAVCSQEMAERYRIVPLSFEGDALRVLARDPVDLGALEDLASELGLPVQPFIAPEFRFELSMDRAFGRTSEDRFARIERMVKEVAATSPVGKPQTIVVDGAIASTEIKPNAARQTLPLGSKSPIASARATGKGPKAGKKPTPAPTAQAPAAAPPRTTAERSAVEAALDAAAPVDTPVEAQGARTRAPSIPDPVTAGDFDEEENTPPEITMELPPDLGGGVVERLGPSDTQRIPYFLPDSRGSELMSGRIEEAAAAAAAAAADRAVPVAQPAVTVSAQIAAPTSRRLAVFDPSPLAIPEARALLEHADHRDVVFEILLRAIRARAYNAAVLTVQGGSAIGRIALHGDQIDSVSITQVVIPLDAPSNVRQAVTGVSPYIGPIATGDAEIDAMLVRLGGVMPPAAMLLPVALKGRTVALLVGHNGADALRVNEMSELFPLAGVAGDALQRIIVRGKTGQQPAAAPPPAGPASASAARASAQQASGVPEEVDPMELMTTQKFTQATLSKLRAVLPAAAPDSDPAAAGGARWAGAAELMAQVQNDDEEISQAAIKGALRRPREVLAWMHEYFPGRLKVDRYELGGRHLRAAQHGPVLDLAVRLGQHACDVLLDKMRDGRREVRYYAVLCTSEIRFEQGVVPLVERLFDTDYGIREVALEGLGGYPMRLLGEALEIPRRALHSEDVEKIKTAANALSVLADVRAIPELLDVHGRGGEAAAIVGKALVRLTKQDFGINNKKWRQWWDKNRRKSRIEWLLEGLNHRDAEIRRTAIEDLRKATGEFFGFEHDQPKKERELARQRWIDWWHQTGQLRFRAELEHERHRPTAVLPPRRN